MASITIKGLDDTKMMMARIAGSKPQLDKFANRILFRIEREGKQETPVRTGTLRRSIHTQAHGMARGYVATNTDYALYVHEGTKRQSKNPFMERAIDKTVAYMDSEIDRLLDEIIG